jgi:Lon protease-like protein
VELPLFPLHAVLCPGVVLPLHVFEDRYKAMIGRCLRESAGFGVVLIREGREVGRSDLALARVGTMADIREARLHPDGRYDLMVVGTRRFALDDVEVDTRPYLVGEVRELGESVGDPVRARRLAREVSERFIRYVGLLRSDDDDPAAPDSDLTATPHEAPGRAAGGETGDTDAATAADDLDEAVRRLTMPDDPTALSYLLGGILMVEPAKRQVLLEAPTTEERLAELREILDREILLLGRRLERYVPDPRATRTQLN